MADKRMLAKTIIESDPFSDMPLEAQMLYVRLNLAADDDGFISNPRLIMRSCGASDDSMKLLITKKFVLTFQRGDDFIYLIKHWKIHNTIQKDRYKASAFKEFLREVYLDENKAYSMTPGEGKRPALPSAAEPTWIQSVSTMDTDCIQSVHEPETQNRLDKIRLDKISLDKDSTGKGVQGENPEPTISDTQEFSTENNNSVISSCMDEKIESWKKRIEWAKKMNLSDLAEQYISKAAEECGISRDALCLNLQSSP